jgi:hypothetical protein
MKTKGLIISSVILSLLVLAGCSPTVTSSSSDDYYEDLTILRPVYSLAENAEEPKVGLPEEPIQTIDTTALETQFDITYEIDSLLDTIAVNNQQIRYVQGYTIQVYTGSSQEEANEAKAEVYKALPGSRPQVTYDLPNYKVKVGKYYYRLQAQKEFAVIKMVFPSAILAPQQFRIE